MSNTELPAAVPSDVAFSSDALARMRRHSLLTQSRLAMLMSQLLGYRISQTEVSQMERGKGFHWGLQRAISRYFRGLGYDVDARGDFIFVRRDAA